MPKKWTEDKTDGELEDLNHYFKTCGELSMSDNFEWDDVLEEIEAIRK